MQTVIRCDAGAVIGGGHVVRCSALGAALRRAGSTVAFAVSDETVTSIPELLNEYPETVTGMSASRDDAEHLFKCWPMGVDLAIVDHYDLDVSFERRLAGWAKKVLVIDDAPLREHVCTHLVDTTFRRASSEYNQLVGADTELLCGSDYAMLREPFRERRNARLPSAPRQVRRILVSMGLSDNANATEVALRALQGVDKVDCVLGAAAPHLNTVIEAVAAGGTGWRLHIGADADTMAELTASADLVVGAPGSASYERCCLGRPSLLVVTAENQMANAVALEAVNAAVIVRGGAAQAGSSIVAAVRSLARDSSRLQEMSLAAAAICDGGGAERVVRVLTNGAPTNTGWN